MSRPNHDESQVIDSDAAAAFACNVHNAACRGAYAGVMQGALALALLYATFEVGRVLFTVIQKRQSKGA